MNKNIKKLVVGLGGVGLIVVALYSYGPLQQWAGAQVSSATPKNRSTVSRELYVYLTKQTYDGNLGGLAGANQKCEQDRPTAVPNGLKYRAFLGDIKSYQVVSGTTLYSGRQIPTNVDWNTLVYGVNEGGRQFRDGNGRTKSIPAVMGNFTNPRHPRDEDGTPPSGSSNDMRYGLAGIYRSARKLAYTTSIRGEEYSTAYGLGVEPSDFWSWGSAPCTTMAYSSNNWQLKNCSTSVNMPSPIPLDKGGSPGYPARNAFDLGYQNAFSFQAGVNYNACNSWSSNASASYAFLGNTQRDFSWDTTDWWESDQEADGESLYIPGSTADKDAIATWSREKTASCAQKHRILCFAQPQ